MTTTAPWWGVPVIAGGFLILGGLLGFFSTFLSDRRKIKREDRRQWDKQLLESYVETMKHVEVFRWGIGEPYSQDDPAWKDYFKTLDSAAAAIESNTQILQLIGDRATLKAAAELNDAVGAIRAFGHDHQNATKLQRRAVRAAEYEFTMAYQGILRVTRLNPNPRMRVPWFKRAWRWLRFTPRTIPGRLRQRRIRKAINKTKANP